MNSILINTQTPPLRLNLTYEEILEKYPFPSKIIDVSSLNNEDFQITVGGVSNMMLDYLNYNDFKLKRWVSLGPKYPPLMKLKDIELHFIDLDIEKIVGYTRFKEGIYNESHGFGKYELKAEDYISFAKYNWNTSEKLLEFYNDTDIYFVHDFQQLLVGGMIGPSAPVVLWYHIPFVPENMSEKVRDFIIKSIIGFDRVIVSTKRDLEGFVRCGIKAKVKQIYPFIDTNKFKKSSKSELEKVKDKLNLKENDKIVTAVGRLDPIKSQDIAIRAIKKVDAKLLVVGDGSFTSKKLGHDKASLWLNKLLNLCQELRLQDKVVFTGYVSNEELACIYEISDVVILPSRLEGFGLTICEAWLYKKPVVVSKGAGISELIIEGVNGYKFMPPNHDELADKIIQALKKGDKIGERGYETLKKCEVKYASEEINEVLVDAIKEYPSKVYP